jgi:hypothetical protein
MPTLHYLLKIFLNIRGKCGKEESKCINSFITSYKSQTNSIDSNIVAYT